MNGRWGYQEWSLSGIFGIGFEFKDGRGWDMDELTVAIGPFRLLFLRDNYHGDERLPCERRS